MHISKAFGFSPYFLLFSVVSSPAQWFWSVNYYEIRAKGQTYHSKGKPEIEGEFTVFTKWPENLEWKIKTDDIRTIKDIGPLSPQELEAKANAEYAQLVSIFSPLISLNQKQDWLISSELKTARERGYSDDEIWSKLNESSPCYSEAKKAGISLDKVASFLESK